MKRSMLVCLFFLCLDASCQSFKGHHLGETTAEFLQAEPKLKEKAGECAATKPRELTEEEIQRKFGKKALKEYQQRRASDGPSAHTAIMDSDSDVYGDRCVGLNALSGFAFVSFDESAPQLEGTLAARQNFFTVDGTGYEPMNPYHLALQRRQTAALGSAASLQASIALSTAELDNKSWLGIDAEDKRFTFSDGKLLSFALTLYAPYGDVVDDISKKLSVSPEETLVPMHNAYGASWNDATSSWNTTTLHVEVSEERNPAKHSAPRLSIVTQDAYQLRMKERTNRPSTVD